MLINEPYFSLLSYAQQHKVIWDEGVYLGVKKDTCSPAFLYQINNFYAEVIYNSTLSKIEMIRSFVDLEELKPYLAKIELTEALECL
jgi:hypothetical protein